MVKYVKASPDFLTYEELDKYTNTQREKLENLYRCCENTVKEFDKVYDYIGDIYQKNAELTDLGIDVYEQFTNVDDGNRVSGVGVSCLDDGVEVIVDFAPNLKTLTFSYTNLFWIDIIYDGVTYKNTTSDIGDFIRANWKQFKDAGIIDGDRIDFGVQDIISTCKKASRELDRMLDEYRA